ncbi:MULTISPECIES: HD-GYP domain-containing protein [unclassified Oceanispirochaeta]|uniref:HD-GYP domain-containing protein n=1 Tax=unclassified Oceanispirochaeta TaxID=2635722 RepID=UPI000E09BBB7|nr:MULTISPECIES: HD-GYP domain-containing protein [unclassified Oceanispirochaeta]MBF9016117.1 HD-GYP domain-containing protein [Oceanispirochaeta sp. M2]NPD72579.1 HD-GYP domain-containing protein [Oceanispirochaeta sp. M1]RDG32033.1 HD-GYP domain-containing protein [Oceanispirochaeta sp. M1]
MNNYKVSDLKPGLSCNKPVYIDEDTLFIPAGVPIREKDLTRLDKWGVVEVQSEGMFAESENEDLLNSRQLWGIPSDKELSAFYNKTLEDLDNLFSRINLMEDIDVAELDKISDKLIDTVENKKMQTIRMVLTHNSSSRAMAKSALNTAILTLTIGFAMNRPRPKLLQLVNGAILHDIGMMRIPEEIKIKKSGLSSTEMNKLKSHTVYSYQIISKELGYDDTIAQIALEHHERWDGDGYPQGKKEDDIVMEARIVSIADSFEAMVSERPYRNSMIGYEAMKHIISDNSRKFDPEILRYFIHSMGIYPLGSIVMLNDSTVARVIKGNPEAPLRPEVITLIDSTGKEYPGDMGPVLNLLDIKNLFIVKAVDLNSLLLKNDTT